MPARRDLFADDAVAHTDLRGQITAPTFTDGTMMRVTRAAADLRLDPTGRQLDRQVLFGHPVRQLDAKRGLSRDETTGYVGYVAPNALSPWIAPTHRVQTRATLLFRKPDIKEPDPISLSCGSLLRIAEPHGKFAQTQDGFFAIAAHLCPVEQAQPDLTATAENLVATPYLWGGNSAFGIDCSGLIQLAIQAAHLPCPGDSDQQMEQVGTCLPDGTPPKRNDLMFWKGHVALVRDETTLIHANAHHMAVAVESIADALSRIERQGDGPRLNHKRL